MLLLCAATSATPSQVTKVCEDHVVTLVATLMKVRKLEGLLPP